MGYGLDFSPDGQLFASLDSNGKLRIWKVADNQLPNEYVPNLHLSKPYTCFAWFTNCDGKDKSPFIALGTSKGGVDIYSYATNKLFGQLKGDGHSDGVTSICLHANTTLYTSGKDCRIVEWSLNKFASVRHFPIDNIVPTYIISLPTSNTLLVGCKELHQWSLEKVPQKKATFTGHSTDILSMKVFQFEDNEYVVTTAKNSREVFLWKIGKKGKSMGTFLMEHSGSVVSCSVVDGKLTIAAVTQAVGPSGGGANIGVVHLFVVEDIGNLVRNPKVTLTVAFDSGNSVLPIPIVAATTNFNRSNGPNILIGYGSSSTLSFERVNYKLNEKKQTLQREDPRLRQQVKPKDKTITPDPHTPIRIGTGNETPKPIQRPDSIEDRIKRLGLASSDDDVKGHSLVETLKQALNNQDATNIRTVLATKDEEVIRTTLKQLPPQFVPTLIDQLTLLTHKKTANVQIAVRWLKLLLQTHASQLMALGKNELDDRFGALLGIIKHRTNSLEHLTALSGRLDFLLNQIKRNTDDDPIFRHENLLVHQDEESDAENGDVDSNSEGGDSMEHEDHNDHVIVNGNESSDDDVSMDGSEG